jgi:hypothetical protein
MKLAEVQVKCLTRPSRNQTDVVGAAPCGRPQEGQPRRVAPTICYHFAHDFIRNGLRFAKVAKVVKRKFLYDKFRGIERRRL